MRSPTVHLWSWPAAENRTFSATGRCVVTRRQRAGNKRATEFERIVAGAQADLDAIAAMHRRPAPATSPPSDVAALAGLVAAELDRREAERARADADASYDRGRAPNGEPCTACGIESCLVNDTPGWRTDPEPSHGYWCEACWRDLHRDTQTIADYRINAITQRLGCTIPLRAMGDPTAFAGVRVFWREFPGAPPAVRPEQRWQHVDLDSLRRQWEAVANPRVAPPDIPRRTTPCPRCGVCRWRADWRPTTWQGPPDYEPVTTGMRFTESCAACGAEPDDRPEPAREPLIDTNRGGLAPCEADRVAAALLGVREVAYGERVIPGLALRVGFRWHYEHAGDRHRRPSAEPWAHLDVERMRRRLEREAV
jgi:hypothetical protein